MRDQRFHTIGPFGEHHFVFSRGHDFRGPGPCIPYVKGNEQTVGDGHAYGDMVGIRWCHVREMKTG